MGCGASRLAIKHSLHEEENSITESKKPRQEEAPFSQWVVVRLSHRAYELGLIGSIISAFENKGAIPLGLLMVTRNFGISVEPDFS